MDVVEVLEAANAAARWHATQKRKGADAEPYVNHPLEVALLVAQSDPTNTQLIQAAFLHDAIEDQKITHETLAETFSTKVADLVREVTDDKSFPKADRKRLQIEKASQKCRDAKLLGLADKISNIRALANSPPAHWPAERIRGYIEWSRTVVNAGLRGQCSQLDQHFDEATARAERSIGTVERAIMVAAQAHAGQIDKAGQPYITHCLRVMMGVQSLDEKIAAVLHDVVEDCPGWSLGRLASYGFSDEALEAVRLLTKNPNGEPSYEAYIGRIKANPIARSVKLADLNDNCDLGRIPDPTQADFDRAAKYNAAIRILEEDV